MLVPPDSPSSANEKHPPQSASPVEQLRKALIHWQTWDAEYEALKEEVEAVPKQAGQAEELSRIRLSFEGSLLRDKEVEEIFGLQTPRPKRQIVNLLQRRIDYVTTNITSLKKQLDAELAHSGAEGTLASTGFADQDGSQITDIVEQLDEDGNILESHLTRSGDTISRINQVLERAATRARSTNNVEPAQKPATASAAQPSEPAKPGPIASQNPSANGGESTATRPSRTVRKKVSFADDTKPATDSTPRQPTSTASSTAHVSQRAQYLQNIMKDAKEQENISSAEPIIPEDEDPEDAELRQQMLKYGMSEVGAIVAKLRLEEGNGSEDGNDFSDLSGDEMQEDEDKEDEEEDGYGRTTGRLIPDEYRQRMLDLEARLGIQSHHSQAAAEHERSPSPPADEGIGRIVNSTTPASAPQAESKSSLSPRPSQSRGAKSVHFAPDLDVAPDKEPEASEPQREVEAGCNPLGDVVERRSAPRRAQSNPPVRLSRFREAAQAAHVPSKSPLSGQSDTANEDEKQDASLEASRGPLADKLVEKDTSSAPAAPDELDDTLDESALADEYHRLRRKFIHRQGGFLKEDESPIQPLDESEGGPPRMSRFKAARLSQRSYFGEG